MILEVDNVWTTITKMPPMPWDSRLRKYFTKKSPDAHFKARYTPGWSGATKFISDKTDRFPTGLLHECLKWCEQEGITPQVIDKRVWYPMKATQVAEDFLKDPKDPEFKLRDYQLEAINAALAAKRGLLGVPTAGGKTEILSAICKAR